MGAAQCSRCKDGNVALEVDGTAPAHQEDERELGLVNQDPVLNQDPEIEGLPAGDNPAEPSHKLDGFSVEESQANGRSDVVPHSPEQIVSPDTEPADCVASETKTLEGGPIDSSSPELERIVSPTSSAPCQSEDMEAPKQLDCQPDEAAVESSTAQAESKASPKKSIDSTKSKSKKEKKDKKDTHSKKDHSEFTMFQGKDCFIGKDAHVCKADLNECKALCKTKGYGAFVVWEGVACFRSQTAEECLANLVDAPTATLYVFGQVATETQANRSPKRTKSSVSKK